MHLLWAEFTVFPALIDRNTNTKIKIQKNTFAMNNNPPFPRLPSIYRTDPESRRDRRLINSFLGERAARRRCETEMIKINPSWKGNLWGLYWWEKMFLSNSNSNDVISPNRYTKATNNHVYCVLPLCVSFCIYLDF